MKPKTKERSGKANRKRGRIKKVGGKDNGSNLSYFTKTLLKKEREEE